MISLDDLGDITKLEMLRMLVGEEIGKGAFRRVYEHARDEDLVVKVEFETQSFCNAVEWKVWENAQHGSLGKWLAPCVDISDSGVVLLQRRTRPARAEDMPDRVPSVLNDLKLENWGWLGDRIVCHDYSVLHVPDIARAGKLIRVRSWK